MSPGLAKWLLEDRADRNAVAVKGCLAYKSHESKRKATNLAKVPDASMIENVSLYTSSRVANKPESSASVMSCDEALLHKKLI